MYSLGIFVHQFIALISTSQSLISFVAKMTSMSIAVTDLGCRLGKVMHRDQRGKYVMYCPELHLGHIYCSQGCQAARQPKSPS